MIAENWAGPLTPDERAGLAARLLGASAGLGFRESDGTYSVARVYAAAELRSLHRDLTGAAA